MEFGQSREYSEQSAAAIDQEVKRLLDECYARACKLLKDHMDKLIAVAEALLERDTLTRADFECVMRGEPLPPMTDVEKMQPSSEAQADPTPGCADRWRGDPRLCHPGCARGWRSLCGTQGRGMKP